jgi:phosphodiesterase/alkaline phosphatase D-like protein
VKPGFGPTAVYFQYGPTNEYGSSTEPGPALPADDEAHSVSAHLSGLTNSTTYHYRAVAVNFAAVAYGPDQTFTTPGIPLIAGSQVGSVTKTGATVSASISPELAPTTYAVEYGPTAAYGAKTTDQAIGSGGVIVQSSATLAGLQPGTTYHYRVLATNAVGAATSNDGTFTTISDQQPPPPPKTCGKGRVLRHGKCVKRHRHRKHHRKHRHHRKGGGR